MKREEDSILYNYVQKAKKNTYYSLFMNIKKDADVIAKFIEIKNTEGTSICSYIRELVRKDMKRRKKK